MTEQEIYRSILQKMIDQTENKQISDSRDLIKQLTSEIKQSNVISFPIK